jgi:uncharacterized membrane protein YebE (DUF533 family)
LLIRAMIAAANADGSIDPQERQQIESRLSAVNLSSEEQAFVDRELASPCRLADILSAVSSPDLARQVYTVSLVAITIDTDTERAYIQDLSRGLGLSPDDVAGIHGRLGVPMP